jgi:hypothetical protein
VLHGVRYDKPRTLEGVVFVFVEHLLVHLQDRRVEELADVTSQTQEDLWAWL